MIRMLLTTLWPALIPLAVYFFWRIFRRRRIKKGEVVEHELSENTVLAWTIIATLALVIAGFVALGLSEDASPSEGMRYTPPHAEGNGGIAPGRLEPSE